MEEKVEWVGGGVVARWVGGEWVEWVVCVGDDEWLRG